MSTRAFAAAGAAIALAGLSGTAFATGHEANAGVTGGAAQAADRSPVTMMGQRPSSQMMGGNPSKGQARGGMMGGNSQGTGMGGMMGMMGNGMMGTFGTHVVDRAALGALVRQGQTGATIDRSANTVSYHTSSVTLVALASPDNKPNMTLEIDGLVNPAITIPAGARLTVDLVNTDWGYMHGFEITTTKPPYPFMSMMAITNDFLIMPVPQRTTKDLATARFYERAATVSLTSGTYHYLCPMPGHAQHGMHGRLIVQP